MKDRNTQASDGAGSNDGVDSLPSELEAALYELLDRESEDHEAALRELCVRNPGHEQALRRAYARATWRLIGAEAEPIGSGEDRPVRSTPADELLHRLQAAPCLDPTRYAVDAKELGRGGMGRILRVEDAHLRRQLAMKAMLRLPPPRDDDERRLGRQKVGRFLEEAQITSQLDHPGVPPVHDIGLDPDGEAFFTMRLVRGNTADHVFALARAKEEGWTRTGALEVLLKVCDTMAFAHDKGVLHRDIKPSNVMVGRFGEVYVMDWGLAKVVGQPDCHDLRIQAAPKYVPVSSVQSVRKEADPESASSLLSFDGQRLGTPHYMSLEQARGEALDLRSDVYAVGAMLYELLTGRAPYSVPGARIKPYQILDDVLAGPPKPVHTLVDDVPAELAAICEKAMMRERANRYRDMLALASDLRAYLDRRTVAAYRTGPVAELRMWTRRNRPLAVALASAAMVLLVGVVAITAQASEARARKQEFELLAARAVLYDRVVERERALFPPWPHKIKAMQSWLDEDLGELERMRPDAEAMLATLHARALPSAPEHPGTTTGLGPSEAIWQGRKDAGSSEANAKHQERPVAAGDPARSTRSTPQFADDSQRFLFEALRDLLEKMDSLAAKERPAVQRRLEWARQVGHLSAHHPDAPTTWDAARTAIALADGVTASERYREHPIHLQPLDGLVPLGMNPKSKLWEFYDLRSAEDPHRVPRLDQASGRIEVGEGTGIVFVLIPGGKDWLGAQKVDSNAPNHFSDAKADEGPPQQVDISPFLLGRYEVTRGQWRRWTGEDPSFMKIGAELDGKFYDASYPINGVSWQDCATTLWREGMRLPSEDEWEYACKAGSVTRWYTGDAVTSLAGHANVADRTAKSRFKHFTHEDSLTDGWVQDAPVGSFDSNAFGLHDMHGNVLEWCADVYVRERFASNRPRDAAARGTRVSRGGSWVHIANDLARSAYRFANNPSFSENYQGVRAARDVR